MQTREELEKKLETLSPDQREIYSHLIKGATVQQIAEDMNRPDGIISAQRTRILNKGIDLPELPSRSNEGNQQTQNRQQTTARAAGPSSNEEVLREAQSAGTAEYDVEKVIEEVQRQGGTNLSKRDVHPMVLLGLTIQFMKLAGGRMHAHQLIEDVYGALRAMVDGGNIRDVPGVSTETKPWPPEPKPGEEPTAQELVQQFDQMQKQLERFLRSGS